MNSRRIPPHSPYVFQDRDLIEIGKDPKVPERAIYCFQYFKKAKVKKQEGAASIEKKPMFSRENTMNFTYGKTQLINQKIAEQVN